MTLLFLDGFDHYNSEALGILKGWSYNTTPSFVTGRFGGLAMSLNNRNQSIPFTAFGTANLQTGIIGFAWKKTGGATSNTPFMYLRDTTTSHIYVRANSDQTFSILHNDGTVLATSTLSFVMDTWHYLELKFAIADGTSGSVDLHVDGVSWCANAGCDTRNAANAYATNLYLAVGSSTGAIAFDDLFIMSLDGPPNNDFIGDVKIETKYPSGTGSAAEWTPNSAVANYTTVDENPANDDTDYNYSSTAAQKDLFAAGNLATATGTVYGTQLGIYARKDDAGDRKLKSLIGSGATEHEGAEKTLSSSYAYTFDVDETDPNTSPAAAWTITTINAVEIGYKLTA